MKLANLFEITVFISFWFNEFLEDWAFWLILSFYKAFYEDVIYGRGLFTEILEWNILKSYLILLGFLVSFYVHMGCTDVWLIPSFCETLYEMLLKELILHFTEYLTFWVGEKPALDLPAF